MTTSSDYVDGVLRKFIARHDGQYLDHSHAYGPQAPDLIEYYLTELLGRPWQFRAGFAADLWDDPQGVMTPDFERIERGKGMVSLDGLRPGDVLVFGAKLDGPGTVGIYIRPGGRVGSVQMFTQNPGPATVVDILADGTLNQLLGAWRLTDSAERKALIAKMKAQFEKPGWPDPGWQFAEYQAGSSDCGHVEIVTATQARRNNRRVLLARLKHLFRAGR